MQVINYEKLKMALNELNDWEVDIRLDLPDEIELSDNQLLPIFPACQTLGLHPSNILV